MKLIKLLRSLFVYLRTVSGLERFHVVVIGILFFSGFAVVGGGGIWSVREMLIWDAKASTLVEVPSIIQYVKLTLGTKGGSCLSVRYSYEFGGTQYESTRALSSDCADDLVEELEAKLKGQVLNNQSKSTAWVDPIRPSEALLDKRFPAKQFHGMVVMGTLFFAIGLLGLICVAIAWWPRRKKPAVESSAT